MALVTGAAGGIGRAIVAALAKAGWTVAATDLAEAGDVTGAQVTIPADLRGDWSPALAARMSAAAAVPRMVAASPSQTPSP